MSQIYLLRSIWPQQVYLFSRRGQTSDRCFLAGSKRRVLTRSKYASGGTLIPPLCQPSLSGALTSS
jgi:hypothetical protein